MNDSIPCKYVELLSDVLRCFALDTCNRYGARYEMEILVAGCLCHIMTVCWGYRECLLPPARRWTSDPDQLWVAHGLQTTDWLWILAGSYGVFKQLREASPQMIATVLGR